MSSIYMTSAKVNLVVSRNGTWVWRAEADLDPALVRPLTPEEFKTVKEALPKFIESLLAFVEPAPVKSAHKKK